jgi:hypothetical protein
MYYQNYCGFTYHFIFKKWITECCSNWICFNPRVWKIHQCVPQKKLPALSMGPNKGVTPPPFHLTKETNRVNPLSELFTIFIVHMCITVNHQLIISYHDIYAVHLLSLNIWDVVLQLPLVPGKSWGILSYLTIPIKPIQSTIMAIT